MTEDEPFIAGIRADPLDDLRRLVYADWLDEYGRANEAEYLRLVATLAAADTTVDPTHPHTVRLLALAEQLDPHWREAVGGRFDLWFDDLRPGHKIHFIKCVRTISGMGLAEAKIVSESLPKVLSGSITFEEAVEQARQIDGAATHRIEPATEIPSRGLVPYAVMLRWIAPLDYEDEDTALSVAIGGANGSEGWLARQRSSASDVRVALDHMRRILRTNQETAILAATIPQDLSEGVEGYSVVLTEKLLVGESVRQAKQWREKLLGGSYLEGETAAPPFNGYISVDAAWG